MAVEIRELVIRTHIRTNEARRSPSNTDEIRVIKKQILDECKRLIKAVENSSRSTYMR